MNKSQDIKLKNKILIETEEIVGLTVFPSITMSHVLDRSYYSSFALLPIQTHSLNVHVASDINDIFEDTDALVTFEKGLSVGVVTADCVPIIVYAPDVKGVAAVHAGWKGTLGGIIDKTVEMLQKFGADPAILQVIFGPSISMLKYEVDEPLSKKFCDAGFEDCITYLDEAAEKPHIDLQKVNLERLKILGVNPNNIKLSSDCTYSSIDNTTGMPLFESHRRSNGFPGRNLTYIYLR